ncbi:MAG TPA: CPBP family glutamic-type intramembrane protease [Kofleriaceae bacterium]|nr:CPBP family glutamic-type intramembrane protease [Kofleriaceae bacterium]
MTRARPQPRRARAEVRRPATWAGHGDLGASLALCFPLVLAYGIGALLVGTVSAVDVPTRALWRLCGHDRTTYLLVYVALGVGFLVWVARAGRRGALTLEIATPVVIEAAIYAMTLAAVIDVLLTRVLGLGAAGGVVAAIGAGLHEELLFRLLGLAGGALLLGRAGVPPRLAWLVALIASSLVFSAAHHWAGEPWDQRVFAFRALAGAAFGLIFWYRSLAHAVWAHALYDLYVLVARP